MIEIKVEAHPAVPLTGSINIYIDPTDFVAKVRLPDGSVITVAQLIGLSTKENK